MDRVPVPLPLRGRFFILSQKEMRKGYTTGSCAAAAMKAAILVSQGKKCEVVQVLSPQQVWITVPILYAETTVQGAQAAVIKDGGDDPDITHGMKVIVDVEFQSEPGLVLMGGEGVGRVTQPGLSVPVGQAAINPGPSKMIEQVWQEVAPNQGLKVTIHLPEGAALAKKTLNPILGIKDGLSILGTTGIVDPMSEEAFKTSLVPQLSVTKALGYDYAVFVPGKIGYDVAAEKLGLPKEAIVQTSNFIGYMLEAAAKQGFTGVLLAGHLGKLVKVAAGIFHTHNRMADARMETLAAYAALLGASTQLVQKILDANTTEQVQTLIKEAKLEAIYELIAKRASLRAERYVFGELKVGTILVSMNGEILGLDEQARHIGGQLKWQV